MSGSVTMKYLKLGVFAIVAVLVMGVAGGQLLPAMSAPRQELAVQVSDTALVARGRAVVRMSDCVACHSAPGGKEFAGGLAMQTPFGTLYSTNITPDKDTGIGAYQYADFERAVRHGVRKDGASLYPAMPFVSYAALTDEDMQALYAFFTSGVQPVAQANKAAEISWPFSMRWPLAWWKTFFGGHGAFVPPQGATSQVARGAYLVEGPGHCGTCHTPRGVAFQEKATRDGANGVFLSGSELAGWYAKSLRHEDEGLGGWSEKDIETFLMTGRNDRTAAFGTMAEVVEHSTQHMSRDDASAIAAYLMTLAPRAGHEAVASKGEDKTTPALYENADHSDGAHAYVAHCAACHRLDGQGTARLFPALAGNQVVASGNPSSLIQITLGGGAMASTPADSSRPSMPMFSKLDDATVASALTFIRTSWGNQGAPVTAADVAAVRQGVFAKKPMDYVPVDAAATQGLDASIQAGQALALDRAKGNCLACHTLKGGDAPSSVGRELVNMKRQFPNRADLVEILNDEPLRNPIAPMPAFGRNHILTKSEIEQIIDFLYTL